MARLTHTYFIVYPPMYRDGDRTYKVYSMLQAKKLVKRLYSRGDGRGYEVWRWRATKQAVWPSNRIWQY